MWQAQGRRMQFYSGIYLSIFLKIQYYYNQKTFVSLIVEFGIPFVIDVEPMNQSS